MNKLFLLAPVWGIVWASYQFFSGSSSLVGALFLGILSTVTFIVTVLVLDAVFGTKVSKLELSNSKEVQK